MRRSLALVVILALLGAVVGQGLLSGGVRASLDGLTMEATYEQPTLDLFGVRWGPALSMRGHAPIRGAEPATLNVLAGVTGTINLPDSTWAVQIQVLTRSAFEIGAPARVSPEVVVAYTLDVPPLLPLP